MPRSRPPGAGSTFTFIWWPRQIDGGALESPEPSPEDSKGGGEVLAGGGWGGCEGPGGKARCGGGPRGRGGGVEKSIPLRAPIGRWCGPLPDGAPAIWGQIKSLVVSLAVSAKGSSDALISTRNRPTKTQSCNGQKGEGSVQITRTLARKRAGAREGLNRDLQGSGETMPGSKRYAAVEGSGKTIQPVGPRVRRNDSLLTRGPRG